MSHVLLEEQGFDRQPTAGEQGEQFVDRRLNSEYTSPLTRERRQFGDGRTDLTADARELADAIDQYKLHHRRRFITYEEMLTVMRQLGYGR